MTIRMIQRGFVAGILVLGVPFCAFAADAATGGAGQEIRKEMKEIRTDMQEMRQEMREMRNPEAVPTAQQKHDAVTMDALERKEAKQSVGEYIDDAGVTAKVKGKFVSQKGLDSLDIKVVTVDGAVTLLGDVDNKAQAELAGNVAREVEGVKAVNNQLVVKQ